MLEQRKLKTGFYKRELLQGDDRCPSYDIRQGCRGDTRRMITRAGCKQRHRAFMICSKRPVKLIVKSRGIGKRKREKESADDR